MSGAQTDWKDQLGSIAIGLLTLEVNTIRKCGMSAQKMPDVPIALHSIVDSYSEYMKKRGFGVTQELLTLASNRIWPPPDPKDAKLWFEELMKWQKPSSDDAMRSVDLTNGVASFEALRWAAAAALRADDDKTKTFLSEEQRAVVARIQANCRQLTPVVLSLQQSFFTAYPALQDENNRQNETPLLIDGTLEQTARACFEGEQTLRISMKVAVLVRKVWDIGVETVLAQTSVQVDGDVVTRVSPMMLEEQRDFLLGLHNTALKTGLTQWKALFDLVATLINGLAKEVFKSI